MNTGNGRRRRRSEDLLDFDKLEETLNDLHWNYSNVVRRIEYVFYTKLVISYQGLSGPLSQLSSMLLVLSVLSCPAHQYQYLAIITMPLHMSVFISRPRKAAAMATDQRESEFG